MITLRKKLFIIIGIVSGLIIAILLGYYLLRDREINIIGEGSILNNIGNNIISNGNTDKTEQTTTPPVIILDSKPVDMSVYAKQVAKIFVERFATYSNQNSNQNIDDVLSMSTPVMVKWLETQRSDSGVEYQGMSTSVVASRIINIDSNNAMVEVDTQQQIMTTSGMELKQRTGRVELNQENNDWKVNGFYWN